MAGAVALASTGLHSCDSTKKALGGATSARPGRPGFPHRPVSRHCPRRQLESRVREWRKVESILLERGLDRSPVCGPAGDRLVVRRTVPPEELRRLARPCVLSIGFYRSRFYYDLPKTVRQKSLGCLRIERNTNILGRPPANWSSTLPRRIRGRSRLKGHPPIPCDKVARLRSYEIRVRAFRTRSFTYCSYGTQPGLWRTPWRETEFHGA